MLYDGRNNIAASRRGTLRRLWFDGIDAASRAYRREFTGTSNLFAGPLDTPQRTS